MEEERMSTDELMDKRDHEIWVELGKVGFDKPDARKALLNEAKSVAEIRNSNATTENNRLSNNARLDIDEQKILVDRERLKVEKEKVAVDAGKVILGVVSGAFLTILGYNMDTLFPRDNRVQKFAEKINEILTLRK